MACNAPNGNCSGGSPCGCGTGGTANPAPVVPLPRCNFALPDGVYQRATVVVQNGCIVEVRNGEPELYTPDPCCAPGSATGSGAAGPRGLPGPAGQAASLAVETNISETGTAWTVQNIGTTTNAIFRFTAPAPTSGGAQISGFTGTQSGFTTNNGLVQTIPSAIARSFTAEPSANSLTASMYTMSFGYDGPSDNGAVKLLTNFDGLYQNMTNYTDNKHAEQAALISTLNSSLSTLTSRVGQLETAHQTLRNEFDAYRATHP